MKIIADIDGWQKEIDVCPESIRRGYFFARITPPMTSMCNPSDLVRQDGELKIQLVCTRNNVFKYIP
jgi:hypothetical protein